MPLHRRQFLVVAGSAAAALAATSALTRFSRPASAAAESFEVTKSEAEWRAKLTDMQYRVLREEATERAFTSPLNKEHRKGTFACAGCDLPLYSSEAKFDSGTGWPSFWESLPDAVATKGDASLFMERTELHCRRCGGHLGHVFDDGPPPTGKRHCINGVALSFKPASA